mmetsp:Transcript_1685/g.5035  ORF Transcript_1685/g.5035 Transcript_1685/m.5035 type:complete len:230 (+) Transcript_1685:1096-1785(+)
MSSEAHDGDLATKHRSFGLGHRGAVLHLRIWALSLLLVLLRRGLVVREGAVARRVVETRSFFDGLHRDHGAGLAVRRFPRHGEPSGAELLAEVVVLLDVEGAVLARPPRRGQRPDQSLDPLVAVLRRGRVERVLPLAQPFGVQVHDAEPKSQRVVRAVGRQLLDLAAAEENEAARPAVALLDEIVQAIADQHEIPRRDRAHLGPDLLEVPFLARRACPLVGVFVVPRRR